MPGRCRPTRGVPSPRTRCATRRRFARSMYPPFLAALLPCLATVGDAGATEGIRVAGDVLQLVLPASAAGLTIAHRDHQGTLQFGESATLALATTFGLKYAIHERRPNGGSHSFPSGHSSICFCSAEFMHRRYGWRIALPAFAVASFVAYSRVESKEHYVHDVLAGAAIGTISSEVLTRPFKGCRLAALAGGDGRTARWLWIEIRKDGSAPRG